MYFSPQGGSNQTNGDGRIIEENLEVINKFNREAKINPDNSVLVEVSFIVNKTWKITIHMSHNLCQVSQYIDL